MVLSFWSWWCVPAFLLGAGRLPFPCACLLFLLFVLDQLLLAIGAGVDLRPRVIEALVTVPVEVQLAIVDVAGLEVDVDMCVGGILMHRGECSGRGEGPLQVVLSEISCLAGSDVLLEGEHHPVVGARLAVPAAKGPGEFAIFLLPAILLQLVAQLPVVAGIAHVIGVVARQEGLGIAPCCRGTGDVASMRTTRPVPASGEAHEDAGHQPCLFPTSCASASVDASSARRTSSADTRSSLCRRWASWLRFTPILRA